MAQSSKGRLLAASALALSLLAPAVALAQTQGGPGANPQTDKAGAPNTVGEIIVTAQRRAERLQDVPVSVSALGARQLERAQITDVRALTNAVPAVTFTSTPYGSNDLILSIRGVAPGGVLPNVDPAVGVYVDGLYYARPEGSNFAMVDMARAEVLRGPQGTLFGRNTIGGALNLTTNEPVFRYEGSLKASYGNYDAYGFTGVLNAPIVEDKLAARFVYSHASHSGYGYDATTHSDVADEKDDYARFRLRAQLSERIRADLSTDFFWGREHQPLWVLAWLDPTTGPAALRPFVVPAGGRTTTGGYNPLNKSQIYDVTGTLSADLGWGTLKSITGYRNIHFNGAADLDATPLPLSDLLQFLLDGDEVTQELQLYGEALDKRLTWLTGAYYFDEKLTNIATTRASATVIHNEMRPENRSSSVFAQATYEIVPHVRLTAGVRFVHDEREIAYVTPRLSAATATPLPLPAGCATVQAGVNQIAGQCYYAPPSIHADSAPWTVGLDYKPNADTLLYVKASKGFRSGGFQQAGGVSAAYYKPFTNENVVSEELGAKLQLLDRHLVLNTAAYHSIYNDIQQNNVLPVAGSVVIAVVNAGKAEINGGEIEAHALIGKLDVNAGLGLIDAKFTSGPYVGTPLPTVAKTTWSVGAEYPIETALGTLTLHADYDWKSKVYFLNTRNLATGQLYSQGAIGSVTQDGYGLVNALATLSLHNGVTVSVWGKNLADKYYAGRAGSYYGSGFNSIVVGDPRTYGATLSYVFE